MHAMQSALAIKRERQKRASRSAPGPSNQQTLTLIKREQLAPPKQDSYALTYFNVGVAFTLMGTFMVLTSCLPDKILGPDWTSLIPIGTLFLLLGIIMVTINQIRTRSEERELKEYVQQRLGRSASGAPLVRTPLPEDDLTTTLLIQNNGETSV